MTTRKQWFAEALPSVAAESVEQWFVEHNVRLRVTGNRTTKLGDFRPCLDGSGVDEISVNGDLNKYFMLLVLLHEMAHKITYSQWGRGRRPHGYEWQENYRNLLKAYFEMGAFPIETNDVIKAYVKKIPLNRRMGNQLERMLRGYGKEGFLVMDNLEAGDLFVVKRQPQRIFRAEKRRRTKWICKEVETSHQYLISGEVEVERIG